MPLLEEQYGVTITLCFICIIQTVVEMRVTFWIAPSVCVIQFLTVAVRDQFFKIDITTIATMMLPPLCVSQVRYCMNYQYSNSTFYQVMCNNFTEGLDPVDCEDGSIRLVGESVYRGRLEMCRNRVWGTVCFSHGFSTNDARAICGILGHQRYGLLLINFVHLKM